MKLNFRVNWLAHFRLLIIFKLFSETFEPIINFKLKENEADQ